MINDIISIPVRDRITGLPWCNVCGKPVERFSVVVIDEIFPIGLPGGVWAHEITGWSTWRYTVECHGESFSLEKRVYDTGGEHEGESFSLRPALEEL